MEKGNHEVLINMTNEQFDEVGNTEMLSWIIMFGAIGNQPGELVTYQPTWHHGHAVMRFLPLKGTGPSKEGAEAAAKNTNSRAATNSTSTLRSRLTN